MLPSLKKGSYQRSATVEVEEALVEQSGFVTRGETNNSRRREWQGKVASFRRANLQTENRILLPRDQGTVQPASAGCWFEETRNSFD